METYVKTLDCLNHIRLLITSLALSGYKLNNEYIY